MTLVEEPVVTVPALVATASMGSQASNLDDAMYGYDLVCATTQGAINATMKAFLDGVPKTEFTACYTYDSATHQNVLTPLDQIRERIGDDPFSIPNGADPAKDPRLQKLCDCKFTFAFRAKMGLPQGVPPASLPDVIVLDKGNANVTYQLYCSDFSVLVLESTYGDLRFSNFEQPSNAPWIFGFEVNLNLRGGAFDDLPEVVKNRVKNLAPGSMFSVQQLLLDLRSVALQQMPTISGLDPSSEAYVQLTRVFINQYWRHLGSDSILLGYTVVRQGGDMPVPSIVPTDLNIEVSPHLDEQHKASRLFPLYTLNYLVMSENRRMPPAVPFDWNWVEERERADFHGTMAARRDIFAMFLQRLMSGPLEALSIDPSISMTHDGEIFYIGTSYTTWAGPANWKVLPVGSPPWPNGGFFPLLSASYAHNSHDSSTDALHTSHIKGDFNYSFAAGVGVRGNVIRLLIDAVAHASFHFDLFGIPASDHAGDIASYSAIVDYTLGVDSYGQLVATKNDGPITDRSKDIGFGTWDKIMGLGDVANGFRDLRRDLDDSIRTAANTCATDIGLMLNGSASWVYPGGQTFSFKQVAFSDHQDLVTHVTYVDPKHLETAWSAAAQLLTARRQR